MKHLLLALMLTTAGTVLPLMPRRSKPHRRPGTGDGPLPFRDGRRREGLLSRGRPGRRPGRAAPARLSDLLAHVPQSDPDARGPLPHHRARLPRLRPERRARSHPVRLHVRPLRRLGGRSARPTRRHLLRDVRDGLRRTGRLPPRPQAPRAGDRPDRSERATPTTRGCARVWDPIRPTGPTARPRAARRCRVS